MSYDPTHISAGLAAIERARDLKELEDLRVKHLGRNSAVTEALRTLGSLAEDERRSLGATINADRAQLERALADSRSRLRSELLAQESVASPLDLTAPGVLQLDGRGHRHPVSQLHDDLIKVFWQMGFNVADGPEVETDWYNFEALLVQADHPARDVQDTFYLEGGNLPRTHTSGVQVRHMETNTPPIRIIAPGKVYRNEDEDSRHSWIFYQVEGLVVDKGISVADLKGTLLAMLQGILGEGTELRLRPNYFPYTEPSVEMDASFTIGLGTSNDPTGGTGWLELGGAGMVHPQVLRNAGIDPSIYSGFAFGFGLERIAAIKYGVTDVREFWRPNLSFLEQF